LDTIIQHGGKRDGAGRKALLIHRSKFILYVTDKEKSIIKCIIKEIRKE